VPDDDTLPVGQIVSAHALRGAVRVRPYQPPAPSLRAGRTVVLDVAGTRREATIRSAAPHARGLVLVELDGVATREAAEALRGARILVRSADLPEVAADEFYWHEVRGFRVETTDGITLGEVAETLATGLNDVWSVRDGTREHLIPVIADVVETIDRAARRIVIRPLPGLLD